MLTLHFALRLPEFLQLGKVFVQDEHFGETNGGHGPLTCDMQSRCPAKYGAWNRSVDETANDHVTGLSHNIGLSTAKHDDVNQSNGRLTKMCTDGSDIRSGQRLPKGRRCDPLVPRRCPHFAPKNKSRNHGRGRNVAADCTPHSTRHLFCNTVHMLTSS